MWSKNVGTWLTTWYRYHEWPTFCRPHIWCVFVKDKTCISINNYWDIPDSKVHGANMGPTWVLSAADGSHGGPTNLAVRDVSEGAECSKSSSMNLFAFRFSATCHFLDKWWASSLRRTCITDRDGSILPFWNVQKRWTFFLPLFKNFNRAEPHP